MSTFEKAGVTGTTEPYDGTDDDPAHGRRPDGPRPHTRSSTARSRVVGDDASVKAAVDTNGNSGFADESGPASRAATRPTSDHVGLRLHRPCGR